MIMRGNSSEMMRSASTLNPFFSSTIVGGLSPAVADISSTVHREEKQAGWLDEKGSSVSTVNGDLLPTVQTAQR